MILTLFALFAYLLLCFLAARALARRDEQPVEKPREDVEPLPYKVFYDDPML